MALSVGCGDDEAPIEPVGTEASTTGAASISSSEFIAAADSRCAEANAALANLSDDAFTERAGITRDLLDGLRSLGSPPDPRGSLDRFYGALEDEAAALEGMDSSAASGSLSQPTAYEEKAKRAAEDLGLNVCGQGGNALPGTETSTELPPTAPVPAPTTTAPAPATTVPVPTTPTPPVPAPAPAPAPAPTPPTGGTSAGGTSGGAGGSGGGGSSGGISPGG